MRVKEENSFHAETHHHKMSTKIAKNNALDFLAHETFVKFE